jgi:DNA-binding LytR/AlgR family response regulator
MSTNCPTAIIADDETPLRVHLKSLLAKLWPELRILEEVDNGPEAIAAIKTTRPDLAFLDIQMPGLDGLEVARYTNEQCHIVFVTAFDHYAVEAFESRAVDYLLKPVNNQRLVITINRLKSCLNASPPDLTALLNQLNQKVPQHKEYLKWLKVSCVDGSIQILSIKEVDFIQSADKYTSVYSNGKEFVIRMTIKKFESVLDPGLFWRIHRSMIIKVSGVHQITKNMSGHYFVELNGYSKPFPVSRHYIHLFKVS